MAQTVDKWRKNGPISKVTVSLGRCKLWLETLGSYLFDNNGTIDLNGALRVVQRLNQIFSSISKSLKFKREINNITTMFSL